jgi:erythrocyte membrane protein band 4.1
VFQKKSIGQELMEQVYYHLDIIEKDYFGLQYTDPYNVPHWLDPTKIVKKQVKSESILLYSAFWSKLAPIFL